MGVFERKLGPNRGKSTNLSGTWTATAAVLGLASILYAYNSFVRLRMSVSEARSHASMSTPTSDNKLVLSTAIDINNSAPPLVTFYPTTRSPPCTHLGHADLRPLECFHVDGKIVGFTDPHTRASTFDNIESWTSNRIVNCSHIDVWIMHYAMFTSPHVTAALASLPNKPPVVAVDHSGEVGETDVVHCMFNEMHKNLSGTRFILASQAASLNQPGQRLFNQHWLVPRELARLEASNVFNTAADELDRSELNLTRSRMLCLGGYPRTQKLQFMGELDAKGLLDRMQWSGGTPDAWLTANLNKSLVAYGYTPEEATHAQKFLGKLPHVLDVDRGAKKASGMTYRLALYNLAHLHLVLESNNRAPSLDRHDCSRTFRYTEKTLKAIYAGARFIIFGDPASLELLRSHGFRTFHPHINETYDTIATYREKSDALQMEIDRILSMSDDEFDTFLTRTQPIVQHNRRWILSDEFSALVRKQALYAYGLSEHPAFVSRGHDKLLNEMYEALNINCKS